MIKYIFFFIIPLLVIVPIDAYATTWISAVPSGEGGERSTSDVSAACNTAWGASAAAATTNLGDSGINTFCQYAWLEWDTTGIPDDKLVQNVTLTYDITASINPRDCEWRSFDSQASTLSGEDRMNEIRDSSKTPYYTDDANCKTVANNYQILLSDSAAVDMTNRLDQNYFSIGVLLIPQDIRDANQRDVTIRLADAILTVSYTDSPNSVEDLTITAVRGRGVDLEWTEPDMKGNTLQSYQINYTTPHSKQVNTVILDATASNTTLSATVSGLIGETDYSFRVGTRTSIGYINGSGNVANTTTLFDPTKDFTAGTYNVTQSGTDVRNFKFSRTDINDTALWLNVTYPNTFDTDCNFYFKFAMVNQTHESLTDVPVNANEDMASFLFLDVDNEIIDVTCIDKPTATNGTYLITQTAFPILDQIQQFRDGDFGTDGNFGALDYITLVAVLISMIGFNRVNPSVGAIMSVIMIGALSFFEIIPWASTLTASTALIIMWAITTTRKP